jgi:hypothetical protein
MTQECTHVQNRREKSERKMKLTKRETENEKKRQKGLTKDGK